MARCGSRAAKSRGRFGLRPFSRLLCSLRLPSAATLFRAHLCNLLDGISRAEWKSVRVLRRHARRAALADSSQQRLCRACRMAPPPFERAVAYGPYQDRMKEAIHALKYDRLHAAARGLGRMLAEAIAQLAAEAPAEMLVVPVPLHRSKYADRGFNQARSLAVAALAALRKTHPEWRLTLASINADAAARHREPGRPEPAPAPRKFARSLYGLRSGGGDHEAHSAH